MPETFIHPTSEIGSGTKIGDGTRIWQHCTVLSGATIGAECLLSQNVYVEGRVVVGNRVKIKNNVCLYDAVTLEDGVFVGPCAVFTNVLTPRSHWPRKESYLPTLVRTGATIGANATIVCGVTIGRFALIGAGSVVTRDVPDFGLAWGNPARGAGFVCHCGERMRGEGQDVVVCKHCTSAYRYYDSGIIPLELRDCLGNIMRVE